MPSRPPTGEGGGSTGQGGAGGGQGGTSVSFGGQGTTGSGPTTEGPVASLIGGGGCNTGRRGEGESAYLIHALAAIAASRRKARRSSHD